MLTEQQQLDRDAAVMLYAAGEMEVAEREAFERRLAAEPELAAQVERLRAAQASVQSHLAQGDAQTRLPASEGVVVRRVMRAIAAWLADRAAAPATPMRRAPIMPWWAYPAAVAASLIVGFLVWSSRQEVPPMDPAPETKQYSNMLAAEQQDLADWLSTSLDMGAEAAVNADLDQIVTAGVPGAADELNPFPMLLPEEASQ